MHRFFVGKADIDEANGSVAITDRDDVKHLAKALRVRIGEKIEISDSEKFEYVVEVKAIESDKVVCDILEKGESLRESPVEIHLYQGLPKSGKMDMIVQKSVELGVVKIIPLITDRIVSKFNDKKSEAKKIDRWQKIADEAAKQAKRGVLPEVATSVDVKALCASIADYDLVLVAYELESDNGIKSILREAGDAAKRVAVVIGPEGGFDAEEVDEFIEAGAKSITLGKRILRTETAGLTCVSVIQYEIGDLGGSC